MTRWICGDPAHWPIAEAWLRERVGVRNAFEKYTCLSLMDGLKFRAVVLFCGYNGHAIEMHVASDGSRRWLTRDYLRACFRYAFVQLGVRRVTGLVSAKNEAALKFDRALGFKDEGCIRQGADDGSDLLVLGMLRAECRFLGVDDGKV